MFPEPTHLAGIVPAVVTPLNLNDQPDLVALQRHIGVLGEEGCDGVLLLGTTGEGPSMGMAEREAILESGLSARREMFLMVGTTTPSLKDTVYLTRRAFELGADAAVVLPPYYYKKVSEQGLLEFYGRLFDEAVPPDGMVLLYHIPQVTQIPISFDLLEKVMEISNRRLVGIKDSSGDLGHGRQLSAQFPELRVFVGTDRLLFDGLEFGAAGCITAGANVLAPLAVGIYREFRSGKPAGDIQRRLSEARGVLESYQPFPATLKSLLARRYGGESWNVRPPLVPLSNRQSEDLYAQLQALDLADTLPWLFENRP
jgi:4-hydroxy-tetrahydrodipicolinate synthase